MFKHFLVSIFLIFTFATAEMIVTVEGLADPAQANARDIALDDAMRNALQEGVGVYLESETLVENYTLVEDRILTKAQGFARVIDIISEGTEADGLFHLKANIAVSEAALEADLKAIIQANGDPRIMIAAKEQVPNQSMIPFTVTKIRSELLKLGFSLVETGNTIPDFGDIEAVSRQALAMGADLALLIDIQASENENAPAVVRNAGFESVFSNLSINVAEMYGSRILYSDTFSPVTGTAASTADEATRKGIESLIPAVNASLIPELSRWIQGAGQADKLYLLSLSNVASYSQIGQLLDALNAHEGVLQVNMRNFAGGQAEVELEYQGTRAGLLALLDAQGLDITGVQDRAISLSFK